MAEKTFQDKINERFRVKVYKATPNADDRHSLEGEPMQKENVGTPDEKHFFVVSAARAEYINGIFKHYNVSEPYIPGVDDDKMLKMIEKPKSEEEAKK